METGTVRRTAYGSIGVCTICNWSTTAARTSDAASALWRHIGEHAEAIGDAAEQASH